MKIRPLFILLLTVGILWGCETLDPLVRDARNAVQSGDYEAAIEATNQALEEDSSNALAYYYKATALGSLAEDLQPPSDRKPYYEDMREAMDNARRFGSEMENPPGELDNIESFITTVWANEHNAGAEILTDDSTRQATPNPEETARDHFINATTVQPDSSISHVVLSSVLYQLGNVEEATQAYEHAMSLIDEPLYEDYEFLISLYFVQNRYEEARDLALQALEEYPNESAFIQFLADSYLETGETERAISLIRDLIEDNPNNPQYYFVLGTQLYRTAEEHINESGRLYQRIYQMQDQMAQLSSSERENLESEIESLMAEAEEAEREGLELADMAVEEIQSSIELAPEDDNAYNVLGIIYQNKAAALFDKRNNTRDNDLAREYDEEAREYLREAMGFYERAAELDPDNTDYWQALFQVYTTLGMDEEAEEAMQKAELE
jgi:tetratricopeptide (TPR) repeat protein